MKNFPFLIIGFIVLCLDACAIQKNATTQPRTLAQLCADSFPCKDSIVFLSVDVPVPEQQIEYIDTTECPPGDTGKTIIKTEIIRIPGRTIPVKTVVMVPSAIDSALRVAYRELQAQYDKSIKDLEDCQSRLKNKKARPSGDWRIWLVVAGLMLVCLALIFRRKD